GRTAIRVKLSLQVGQKGRNRFTFGIAITFLVYQNPRARKQSRSLCGTGTRSEQHVRPVPCGLFHLETRMARARQSSSAQSNTRSFANTLAAIKTQGRNASRMAPGAGDLTCFGYPGSHSNRLAVQETKSRRHAGS